jgi:ornithine decarboxylase
VVSPSEGTSQMNKKIEEWMRGSDNPTPYLVVDLDIIKNNYVELQTLFPTADIYYAVKANPANDVISLLDRQGSFFDTASIKEIETCLQLGVKAENISFGNTIKKQRDIRKAYQLGIRLFAFDSEEELRKISIEAPNSKVFCRILTDGEGAEWPLSRKFGCETDMAINLLVLAKQLGLIPYGISFHVGSQQTQIPSWRKAIHTTGEIFSSLEKQNIHLEMINLGGGFPIHYTREIPRLTHYAYCIHKYLGEVFGDNLPRIILEPGRSMVGNAGMIVSEVILVSKKSYADEPRWVYLDIGKFGGLAETMDESIRYKITTDYNTTEELHSILAGPTCDSADILYEKNPYLLPRELKAGDYVYIHGTGAYTQSYSAVSFNGFEPLKSYYI